VYDAAVALIEISDDEFVPSFASIHTREQRVRSDYMPPIPVSIDDVTINNEWSVSWKTERFLLKLDNYWDIVVFATRRMLKTLKEVKCLYIDGSWNIPNCPTAVCSNG